MKSKGLPRGLANNNPLNIRKNSDVFQGEVVPSKDTAFKQFKTMAYGYRAAFRILYNYYHKYSLNTIEKMIGRWAPPEDKNNTAAYVKVVCSKTGIPDDREIEFDKGTMTAIAAAMCKVENGREAVMSDVIDGWNLL